MGVGFFNYLAFEQHRKVLGTYRENVPTNELMTLLMFGKEVISTLKYKWDNKPNLIQISKKNLKFGTKFC